MLCLTCLVNVCLLCSSMKTHNVNSCGLFLNEFSHLLFQKRKIRPPRQIFVYIHRKMQNPLSHILRQTKHENPFTKIFYSFRRRNVGIECKVVFWVCFFFSFFVKTDPWVTSEKSTQQDSFYMNFLQVKA